MTAKIKLNAASGGGSFSLQAPSSSSNNRVLTLPDAADGIVAQTDSSGNFSVSGTTTCTGNLKAGTITDTSGNNSSTTAQIAQGRAKAWIRFDGTGTPSITDSFNISSITEVDDGQNTVAFTTAFANTNYCGVFNGSTSDSSMFSCIHTDHIATGSCRIITRTGRTTGRTGVVFTTGVFFGDV